MFLVLGTRLLPVSHFWSCELVVLKVSDGPGTPVTWKKEGPPLALRQQVYEPVDLCYLEYSLAIVRIGLRY